MTLTAADVRATTFATTRMHLGYNMDEVDEFLDIVEADIAQLTDQLQRSRDGEAVLRAQCDQLQLRVTVAEKKVAEVEAELAALRVRADSSASIAPPAELMALVAGNQDAEAIIAAAQQAAIDLVHRAVVQADAIRHAVRATLDQQRALLDED